MPNKGHFWSADEVSQLLDAYQNKPVYISNNEFVLDYAKVNKLTVPSVRGKLVELRHAGKIISTLSESTYPVYNSPLTMEGDALIITDLELPFHHADFVNRVLDLARKWQITQLILGGDVLHFDSLSGWEPSWKADDNSGLDEKSESALMEFAKTLSPQKQGEFYALWGEIGNRTEQDGASTELAIARKEIKRLAQQFDRIDFILGNHEGRFLRTMQTAIDPKELTRLLELGDKWRIAPYYYSVLISNGERFQVEHPKNSAKASAWKLAAKYGCNVIMGHNHQVVYQFDISGRYYAIEIGCGVDERRLPYAAQRHNAGHAHALGACIVRGGFPWLLHSRTDWKALSRA